MCESTGGTCLADPESNTAKCECQASIIYNKGTGCKGELSLLRKVFKGSLFKF